MHYQGYRSYAELTAHLDAEKLSLDLLKENLKRKYVVLIEGGHSQENLVYKDAAPDEERGILSIADSFDKMGLNYRKLLSTDVHVRDHLAIADLTFIYAHGEYGEDGRLQGWLDYLNVAYPGPGLSASALCSDKLHFKYVIRGAGISTPEFFSIEKRESFGSLVTKAESLGYPVMLKDRRGGSSLGITLIADRHEMKTWYTSHQGDDLNKYFIEKFIDGEFATVGIIRLDSGYYVLPVLTASTEARFYDAATKLGKEGNNVSFTLESGFDPDAILEIRNIAWEAFTSTECEGIGRVDIMISDGKYYVLEINTIPGISRNSNFTAMFTSLGFTYDELILAVINTAYSKRKDTHCGYETVKRTRLSESGLDKRVA
jgi:D-alanine-D-alanine ligase